MVIGAASAAGVALWAKALSEAVATKAARAVRRKVMGFIGESFLVVMTIG